MTIQLTIYIVQMTIELSIFKRLYNSPYTWPNDYTIDYIHS